MGAAGAVNILYRKSTPEEKQEIIKDYEDKFSNPYCAAERGLIDEVIMPRDTRYKLIQALEMCHNKNQSNPPKKHGNMRCNCSMCVYPRRSDFSGDTFTNPHDGKF